MVLGWSSGAKRKSRNVDKDRDIKRETRIIISGMGKEKRLSWLWDSTGKKREKSGVCQSDG